MFVAMLGWLLCLIHDRVSHARVSHMCLAFYCFMDRYVVLDERCHVRCMLVCMCELGYKMLISI